MIALHGYGDIAEWRADSVCITVGYFDGVHRGHTELIRRLSAQAKQLGSQSLVVTFSNSPKKYHSPEIVLKNLSTPEEKLMLLGETGADAALMLEYGESIASQSAGMFIKGISHYSPVHGLCVGYDNSIGNDLVRGRGQFEELCDRLGIELCFVEPIEFEDDNVKSSLIRDLISEAKLEEARELLGRPYAVMSGVQHGKGRGREFLGIPTANMKIDREKLLPPVGVYSATASVMGSVYPAAVCVMTAQNAAETVLEKEHGAAEGKGEADPRMLVETHLIGFDGDLYGLPLDLRFITKLRGWTDFDTSDALRKQMLRDIEDAREAALPEISQQGGA